MSAYFWIPLEALKMILYPDTLDVAQKNQENVKCMEHRDVVSRHDNYVWNHTLWTCDCADAGKSWDGLKENCHVLNRGEHTTQVCQDYTNCKIHSTILP